MAKKIKKFENKSGTPTSVEAKIFDTIVVPFELKSLHDDGEDFFIVEGYASAFGLIDTFDDRIEKGAYLDTIKANPDGFPAFVMHDRFNLPVGLFFELKEDSKGLFVKARLPKSDDIVKGRLVPQIKAGSVNALSIGFRPLEFKFIMEDEIQIRVLTKIELREISFINLGMQADPEALLTDIKKNEKFTEKQNMINAMVDVYRKGSTSKIKIKIVDFYHEDGKSDPFTEISVISTDELKNLSKSNLVYAIKELQLSTNASNYLAGLALTPVSQKNNPDGDDNTSTNTNSPDDPNGDKSGDGKDVKVKSGLDDLIETLKTQQETSNE